jgi:hypothetical protein
MSTGFLDRLATQLKTNKNAPRRRAVQRILDTVKKNYEEGQYTGQTEAEREFRKLVERDEACK